MKRGFLFLGFLAACGGNQPATGSADLDGGETAASPSEDASGMADGAVDGGSDQEAADASQGDSNPSIDAGDIPDDGSATFASCAQKACFQANAQCGTVASNCGAQVECGSCAAPQACGYDGLKNHCGKVCENQWLGACNDIGGFGFEPHWGVSGGCTGTPFTSDNSGGASATRAEGTQGCVFTTYQGTIQILCCP